MLENFPLNYLPEEFKEDEDRLSIKTPEDFKCIRSTDYTILEHSGIPSTMSLLTTDATPIEDTRLLKHKRIAIKEK